MMKIIIQILFVLNQIINLMYLNIPPHFATRFAQKLEIRIK